ncbi:MAG: putative O-glycosylation ligase, exosortase A system-associated [Gammaproteobacteria bacterium]|nr:putative O-glycosylation ligase, exosortase A system-associated [Gammaproteobacteria bacterium]
MLRDLAVLLILIAFIPLIFQRPWTGVLALAVFDYLNPHEYVPGFMNSFPTSKLLFVVTVLATVIAIASKRLTLRWVLPDWRPGLMVALAGWFYITSQDSVAPPFVWPMFEHVIKSLLVIALTLFLIDTREKALALIAVIALSFSLVAIKGGYWAFMTGFQDRVYGPPGSAYADNNHFAVASMMTLPLLILLFREVRSRALQVLLVVSMAACLTATLSSWSRGGLVTLTVTLVLLLLFNRRKMLALPVLLVPVAAYLLLPGKWSERMQSMVDPESSAAGRLAIWRLGLDYMKEDPWTGSGFQGWLYVGDRGGSLRDWHSAYIEILAEHGIIGLAIWGALLVGSIGSLLWLTWQTRQGRGPDWINNYSSMLAVSLIAYATGALTVGISYWPVYFQLILVSAILHCLASARLIGNAQKTNSLPALNS